MPQRLWARWFYLAKHLSHSLLLTLEMIVTHDVRYILEITIFIIESDTASIASEALRKTLILILKKVGGKMSMKHASEWIGKIHDHALKIKVSDVNKLVAVLWGV